MSSFRPIGFHTEEGWNKNWTAVFDHYQSDIRHAYYIRAMLEMREARVLEIGAGSFRDVVALARWGIDAFGIDYSSEAVRRAQLRSADIADRFCEGNAFELPFADQSFDVTYHNGLWGYFDDKAIVTLAREQARITRGRVMATVHNAHNSVFHEYFRIKSIEDKLYGIRFFEVGEITNLMRSVCSSVLVVPVGKAKTSHEDDLINRGAADPRVLRPYLEKCKFDYLSVSERLLCIGTV